MASNSKGLMDNAAFLSVSSIVIGLAIGALVMLLGGYDPILAYRALLEKAFGSAYDIAESLRAVVPLVIAGLAVSISFRAGVFNIGVDGQIIMGTLGALIVGRLVPLPPVIHPMAAILAGAVLGGLWGSVIGLLKRYRGINEIISGIMLNWIALYISNMVIRRFVEEPGTSRSLSVLQSASIQLARISGLLQGARIHWGFLAALLLVFAYAVVMNRSRWGFEIRATGLNPHAAGYAGIPVSRVMIRTLFVSGLLGGLVGTFEVLGVFQYVAISPSTSGIGFDGIAVALLGMNNALGITLAALLLGLLNYGAQGMGFTADVPGEVIRMVISVILFFAAAPGLLRLCLGRFTRRGGETGREG